MDHEGARVHIAHRVDEAHDAPGPAHVQAGQWITERVQVEEGIARQHLLAVGEQPVVDLALLAVRGMEVVPAVRTAPARAQPRDAQLSAVAVGERLERVQLGHVLAGDDHADLERAEVRFGEVVHRPAGHVVAPGATHHIVRRRVDPVEADLDVQVVHRREPTSLVGIDERAVRGELHADPDADRVLDELEEVAPHHRLAAADVDVEHLQVAQLVEHALGFGGGELSRVALPGGRQAVDALQVARIRELPRQADRGIEPCLELADERFNGHG